MIEDKEVLKTGTTTVAVVCKGGLVLCADKRVTSGHFIAYKTFDKIFNISDDMAVTVAGTVSDVQLLSRLIRAELKLKTLRTGKAVFVSEAVNLLASMVYNNIRKLSLIPGITHFILGGKDSKGFHLWDVGADGAITEAKDFVSSGSGSVMAYGVLETMYKKDMQIDEGVTLVIKALNAALQRDAASGNGFDVVTITKDGVKKILTKEIDTTIEQ